MYIETIALIEVSSLKCSYISQEVSSLSRVYVPHESVLKGGERSLILFASCTQAINTGPIKPLQVPPLQPLLRFPLSDSWLPPADMVAAWLKRLGWFSQLTEACLHALGIRHSFFLCFFFFNVAVIVAAFFTV